MTSFELYFFGKGKTNLKLMSAIFFISPKQNLKKLWEMLFFTQNILLDLEIFKFLSFSSFLSSILWFKREVKNWITMLSSYLPTKYLLPKEFLECIGYIFSYLPKLINELELVSVIRFLHIFGTKVAVCITLSIDQVPISDLNNYFSKY